MKKAFYKIMLLATVPLFFTISSCKKSLDVPYPANSINTQSAFTGIGTINGMMNQLYTYFDAYIANTGHGTFAFLADESYNPSTSQPDPQTNNTIPTTNTNLPISWDNIYKAIYLANTLLEGIPGATAPGFTDAKKQAYIAAVKTIRAYAYFQLVRVFGDVPLLTSTDVPTNGAKPRDAAATVYAAIEKDLQDAAAALPATLSTKYFINNKYQPEAVLANVYLAEGKWAQAEAAASDIITGNLYQLSTVTNVFLQSSAEGIVVTAPVTSLANPANNFKLGNVIGSWNFPEGVERQINELVGNALSPDLLGSFETGDLRLTNWVVLRNMYNYPNPNNRMFPYKYKYWGTFYTGTIPAGREEDSKIIRLAEIYLVRAEARAQQNNLANAATDLNLIRTRAGLPNTTASSQTDMIDAVLNERRHELFCECGYRWYDLVRTGKANAVLSVIPYKVNWKPYMTLFPLTPAQLAANSNLTQTPGY